jgi:hypothetical protein
MKEAAHPEKKLQLNAKTSKKVNFKPHSGQIALRVAI